MAQNRHNNLDTGFASQLGRKLHCVCMYECARHTCRTWQPIQAIAQRHVWGVIGGTCHVLDRSEDWIGVSSLGWVGKQQRNGQVRFSCDFHWMAAMMIMMMMVYYPVYYPQWNLYTYY